MRIRSRQLVAAVSVVAAGMVGATATTTVASAEHEHQDQHKRVLLISVDGLHQYDLARWVAEHPRSNLARLTDEGTEYTRASLPSLTDSFPGLLAPLTGGTPKTTGVFYDDSYSRALFAPGSSCTGTPGTEVVYDESIDVGAATATRPILGGKIDPAALPEKLAGGACEPVLPNEFVKTNTVFGVAHEAGLRTAWSDKHPAYQLVNGHGTPNAVDDLFTPEINADLIPASLVDTRGRTITFPHPNPTGTGPYFITDYVGNTESYDQIKVDGVLNEIDGRSSAGASDAGVPAIFGMNFQTVSVAQKDVDPSKTCDSKRNDGTPCDPNYVPGAYVPGTLAFTPQMEGGLGYVDGAIGSIVHELKARGLFDSTEIIVTAKHGQSPIDPAKLAKIGGADADVLTNAGIDVAQITHDDVSLIWLANQGDTAAAVHALETSVANGNPARISKIFSDAELATRFGNPHSNDRTPDIIVQPVPGTIYSKSSAKVAEHGGLAPDDNRVALLVVNGAEHPHHLAIGAPVSTAQIAPTILRTLGINPRALDAVRQEGTRALPGG